MDGYLIQDRSGLYLTQGLFWCAHKKSVDAHIFPKRILEAIKEVDWHGDKPYWAIPARYTPEEGVIVTGDKFRITLPYVWINLG